MRIKDHRTERITTNPADGNFGVHIFPDTPRRDSDLRVVIYCFSQINSGQPTISIEGTNHLSREELQAVLNAVEYARRIGDRSILMNPAVPLPDPY